METESQNYSSRKVERLRRRWKHNIGHATLANFRILVIMIPYVI